MRSPHQEHGVNGDAIPHYTETDRRACAAVARMVAAGYDRVLAIRYVWERIAAGDTPRLDCEVSS